MKDKYLVVFNVIVSETTGLWISSFRSKKTFDLNRCTSLEGYRCKCQVFGSTMTGCVERKRNLVESNR